MNFNIRDLINLTKEQVLLLPNYKTSSLPKILENRLIYQVQFDDCCINLTKHQIVISWCYWELFRCFPCKTILSTMCVNKDFNSSTHRKLGELIIWHIYNEFKTISIWQLSKTFYDLTNLIYNLSCVELGEYVTTVSIYDITEILNIPELLAAKAKLNLIYDKEPDNEFLLTKEIAEIYKVLNTLLFTNKDYLKDNQIKKLCLAGVVNKGQMMQLFAPRGYVHDIDNCVFPYPITTSFAEGLTTLYDSAIESRSASKAYIMTTDPLEQSELFNRKIQLAASAVLGVVKGSCDHYKTIDYFVRAEDKTLLKGKYYMEADIPILIDNNFSDLVGKIIKIRTITGCGCYDPQYVCEICLGWVNTIIPPGTNLGFALSTPLCARVSQNIMSTKHYDASSSSKAIFLNKIAIKWFITNPKHPNKLYLTEYAISQPTLIRIENKFVESLHQILHINVQELVTSRISEILYFGITHLDKDGQHDGVLDKVNLTVDNRGVSLSTPMLQYIKQQGWNSGKGYIEFTITDWNVNTPIFNVPKIGDNIMSFFNDLKSFINAQKQNKRETIKITNFKTRGAAINALIELLDMRLKGEYNLVQVEIFIRSLMMIDYKTKQFGLPTTLHPFHFIGLEKILFNRNLVSLLAYQEQYKELLKPHWQTVQPTTKHMLDSIIRY